MLAFGLGTVLAIGAFTDPFGNRLARASGWYLLAGLVVMLLFSWLWRFRPQIWNRPNAVLLIALVVLGATIAVKVTGDRPLLPYVIPIAAVGLLLAVLLDAGVALIVTGLMALVGGAIVGTVEYSAYAMLGGTAGVILVRRGERFGHFAQAAVAIGIVQAAVVLLFTLLGTRDLTGAAELVGAALASAGGSAVAALGSFVVVGNVFGITTSFQLLELANPSQPLLRRLLLETPGTYHHSLMVGNLAERAAEAIGADPLSARVAAYYHDIGKLANPLAYHREPGRRPERPRRADAGAVGRHGRRARRQRHRPRLRVQAAQADHRVHPAAPRHGADELLLRKARRRPWPLRRHARLGRGGDRRRDRRRAALPPPGPKPQIARGGHPDARRRRRGLGPVARRATTRRPSGRWSTASSASGSTTASSTSAT